MRTDPGYLRILDSRGRRIPVAAHGAFEGAATGRRMSAWGTSTAGPSAALFASLANLRSRSRELVRNQALVDGGADSYVANLIGSGINPRWQLKGEGMEALKETIQELWDDWTQEADFSQVLDFYGLQSLVCRGLLDAGEILCRLIPRRPEDGLSVPLQIQLLEADHLDETHNTVSDAGNEIRMGIEIDAEGRRVAYHLWAEHPGETFVTHRFRAERRRIPAFQVLHVFRPLRAGQMRGRPWFASIIVRLHELDQYDDAELVRKKAAAMIGAFVTEPMSGSDPSQFFGKREPDDDRKRQVGHAWLNVLTSEGKYSLDNRQVDVKLASELNYTDRHQQTGQTWKRS